MPARRARHTAPFSSNDTGGDTPEQVTTEQVSPPFFHLLGATPVLGRTFTTAEDLSDRRQGRGPFLSLVDATLRGRSSDRGENDLAQRRTVRGHRCHREQASTSPTSVTLRTCGRCFQSIRTRRTRRTTSEWPGRLAPGVTLAQETGKAGAIGGRVPPERFPGSIGPKGAFSVELMQKVFVRKLAVGPHRPDFGRCGSTAHRVRQCRQFAARALDGEKTGTRDSRGDGRRPRPHHSTVAHGKRAALNCGRGGWVDARPRRDSFADVVSTRRICPRWAMAAPRFS